MTFWWWEGLKAVTEFSDEANRQGEYQAVRDTGKGTKQAKLRAAYAAREGTIDFTRAGRLGRKANRVVAFFNPALQGGSKLYREAKKNPRRLIARGLIISMLSLLFWLLRYGDERKQELWHEEADYAKDLYWIYYTDDGHKVMIPKPFEPGIIFGSTVERALEIWQERDPEVARHFARSAIAAGLPNMLPQLMVVPGELWANKSFFTGRPIVPLGESRFEPGYQYGPRTTETAKAIGRRTGLSPYKVDHAVRGLFGGLGAGVMQLGDVAAGKAAEKRSPAESIPGVGRFYRSDLTGSQSVDKFYTELTALRKAKATADAGRKAADYDENRLIVLESAYDDISLYRSEQKDIMESDAWSPAEKRRSVADLDLQIVNAARAVYDKAPIEAPKKRK
jgi:hypothetical protein